MIRFLAVAALLLSGVPVWAEAPWLDSLAAAQKASAASGKPILVDVTGSDWCQPCQLMEAEVFSRAEFASVAAKYVLLRIDFPRKTTQAEALRVQNKAFAARYPFDGFPTFFVLDSRGTAYGRHTGRVDGGVVAFDALVTAWEGHRPVLTGLVEAAAKAAPGADRAKAQDALFRQAEEWDLTAQFGDLPLKIVQEDRDGKAGLKARYQVYNAYQRLLATWTSLGDPRRAVDEFDSLAGRAVGWPDLRQKILFTKAMVQLNALDDEIPARDTFRVVRDLVPGTATARQAAGFLDRLP